MSTLLIALLSGIAFLVAYHTYGKWLGRRIFQLSASVVCPSARLRDDNDYVPTPKFVVFGHHFTSIAGTGPIVGPAIAVMWGWLPALLWVVFGSIFIGAVHDLGALVVSLRNNGQTVGDIAGRVLNRRVRILFLLVLFLALSIVLAIFGLVIANVFDLYPATIFPVWVQIPIAVCIGIWLHKRGAGLFWPSLIALALMYVTVIFGDRNFLVAEQWWLPAFLHGPVEAIESGLHAFNHALGGNPGVIGDGIPIIAWCLVLLVYAYIASVIPVWTLLQPRDYINSLQLISAMGLIVLGLVVAAFIGGAPPVEGADRVPLEIAAPMVNWNPEGAPMMFPFLFITVACGAISGFHCLVSSGTSSKQLKTEPDARFVGFGGMLTEGFLAVIVILACVAGLGLGTSISHIGAVQLPEGAIISSLDGSDHAVVGYWAFTTRYTSWSAAGGLARTVSAFVDGAGNFLTAMNVPRGVAVALLGVLVASFAGTTLDTACRLQRYVIQELAATFAPRVSPTACGACGYDLSFNQSGTCPECGAPMSGAVPHGNARPHGWNFWSLLTNKHGATIVAIAIAMALAALPAPGDSWSLQSAGKGGLILWPMFGATNQLLGGLAFMVIAFYLWRRNRPTWFLLLPLVFMLIMPAWALSIQLYEWINSASPNWTLLVIAAATLALEVWMVVEAVLLWPKARGEIERLLPGAQATDPLLATPAS